MRPNVCGRDLDGETRCAHWRSARDIIAIRMFCCGVYFACRTCHDEAAGHEAEVWPRAAFGEKAVLCGACGLEMSIDDYLGSGHVCPECGAAFNPGCRTHHHLYFEAS